LHKKWKGKQNKDRKKKKGQTKKKSTSILPINEFGVAG
jgi:hypothetical protein